MPSSNFRQNSPVHHTKRERWEATNKEKTNATFEATDERANKNCSGGTVLERPVDKLVGYVEQTLC